MKSVTELYKKHTGSDIYVVGTGASMRIFPVEFLEGKITIGLNMAWKLAPVTYCLTTRPELNIAEFMPNESPHPEIIWITKFEKLLNEQQRAYAVEKNFHFFKSKAANQTGKIVDHIDVVGRNLNWVREPTEDYLYLWSSVSQTAANLAANMGAKNIILVGCDNGALNKNHHAHQQHTMWKNKSAEVRYNEYYQGLIEVREALRSRGVSMTSLTPFLSPLEPEKDFRTLCSELKVAEYIENENIADRYGFSGIPSWFASIYNTSRHFLKSIK